MLIGQTELVEIYFRRLCAWCCLSSVGLFSLVACATLMSPSFRVLLFALVPPLRVLVPMGWLWLSLLFAMAVVFNDLHMVTSASSTPFRIMRRISSLLLTIVFGLAIGLTMFMIMRRRWERPATQSRLSGDDVYSSPFTAHAVMASSVLAAISLLHTYHNSHLRNITITPPAVALQRILGRVNATYASFCSFARVFLQGALHNLRPAHVEPPDADDLSEADVALRHLLGEAQALRPFVHRAAASVFGVVLVLIVGRQLHYFLSTLPLSRQPLLFFFELCLRSLDLFERLLIRIYQAAFPREVVRVALDGFRSLCFGLAIPKANLAGAAKGGEKLLLSAVFSLVRAALLQVRALSAALAHALFDHKTPLSLWVALWEASLAYAVTLTLAAGGLHAMLLILLTPVNFFRLADADAHALSLASLFFRFVASFSISLLFLLTAPRPHSFPAPSLLLQNLKTNNKEAAQRRSQKKYSRPQCAALQTRVPELFASTAPRLQERQEQQLAGDREAEACRESTAAVRFSHGRPSSSSSRSAQVKYCTA